MSNDDDFEAMLADYDKREDPQVGERVFGKIISIGREHVFVDLGAVSEGALELDQVTDADGRVTVEVGDTIEATVVNKDATAGTLFLRSKVTGASRGPDALEQAFESELPVEGLVTGTNKGGVEVQLGNVRAFCPISQLDTKFVENAEDYVGQKLEFAITKYEGGRRPDIVVSRRALLEREQQALAEQTREMVEVGAVLPGKVVSLKPYGAFVDIGGIQGMVHISELGFGHVDHPSDVLHEGQVVEVAVLRVEKTDDPRRPEKIALSIRALEKDPWQDADQRFPAGSKVEGTVARLQPFGAFVELAPGVQGLVHVSELGAGRRVNHPKEVVNVGDTVEATVLSVDLDKRRIALSMDAARADAAEREEREAVSDYNAPSQSLGTLGDLLAKAQKNKQTKKKK